MVSVFSFRAECADDVEVFLRDCKAAGILVVVHTEQLGEQPDAGVEIHTASTLEQLSSVLRLVPDGHVMLQTLKACSLAENSLLRDRGIE